MAEAKTKATEQSVSEFLGKIADDGRRNDCFTVVELMSKATGVEPKMWGASIVGFGSYKYRYESGREGEWPIIGFSPRKNDLTLYLKLGGLDEAAGLLSKLGKHKTGKGCLYLKKLDDVDLSVLKKLIKKSVASMADQRISS